MKKFVINSSLIDSGDRTLTLINPGLHRGASPVSAAQLEADLLHSVPVRQGFTATSSPTLNLACRKAIPPSIPASATTSAFFQELSFLVSLRLYYRESIICALGHQCQRNDVLQHRRRPLPPGATVRAICPLPCVVESPEALLTAFFVEMFCHK